MIVFMRKPPHRLVEENKSVLGVTFQPDICAKCVVERFYVEGTSAADIWAVYKAQ